MYSFYNDLQKSPPTLLIQCSLSSPKSTKYVSSCCLFLLLFFFYFFLFSFLYLFCIILKHKQMHAAEVRMKSNGSGNGGPPLSSFFVDQSHGHGMPLVSFLFFYLLFSSLLFSSLLFSSLLFSSLLFLSLLISSLLFYSFFRGVRRVRRVRGEGWGVRE